VVLSAVRLWSLWVGGVGVGGGGGEWGGEGGGGGGGGGMFTPVPYTCTHTHIVGERSYCRCNTPNSYNLTHTLHGSLSCTKTDSFPSPPSG